MSDPKKNYKVYKFRDTFVIGLSANKPTINLVELKELLKDLPEIKKVLADAGEDTSFMSPLLGEDTSFMSPLLGAQSSFARGDQSVLEREGVVLGDVKEAQDRFEEYLKKKDEELQAQLEISRKVWAEVEPPEGI
jgi:hypothetical protein